MLQVILVIGHLKFAILLHEMLQYSITMPIIKDNIAIENIVCRGLTKLLVLYLPHLFKILNEDSGIEHRWNESYQKASLQVINEVIPL
jgi:hypothetical protein